MPQGRANTSGPHWLAVLSPGYLPDVLYTIFIVLAIVALVLFIAGRR